jgi:hypothetical protein
MLGWITGNGNDSKLRIPDPINGNASFLVLQSCSSIAALAVAVATNNCSNLQRQSNPVLTP